MLSGEMLDMVVEAEDRDVAQMLLAVERSRTTREHLRELDVSVWTHLGQWSCCVEPW